MHLLEKLLALYPSILGSKALAPTLVTIFLPAFKGVGSILNWLSLKTRISKTRAEVQHQLEIYRLMLGVPTLRSEAFQVLKFAALDVKSLLDLSAKLEEKRSKGITWGWLKPWAVWLTLRSKDTRSGVGIGTALYLLAGGLTALAFFYITQGTFRGIGSGQGLLILAFWFLGFSLGAAAMLSALKEQKQKTFSWLREAALKYVLAPLGALLGALSGVSLLLLGYALYLKL